jgi:hypothetical protein
MKYSQPVPRNHFSLGPEQLSYNNRCARSRRASGKEIPVQLGYTKWRKEQGILPRYYGTPRLRRIMTGKPNFAKMWSKRRLAKKEAKVGEPHHNLEKWRPLSSRMYWVGDDGPITKEDVISDT